jgi:hypothetical protein
MHCAVTVDYGPLALEHLLAMGGAAWFRRGMCARGWKVGG